MRYELTKPLIVVVALTTIAAVAAEAQTPQERDRTKVNRDRLQSARPIPLPDGVRAMRDVPYARVGDTPLLLDLYIPQKSNKPLPLVVWVHGGGWRGGSKERCPALPLTKRGFAVASIGYRLSGRALFPAQIEDCKAAIRWLRANAEKLNLAPDRIAAWGSSAGGHLVALLGTSGDVQELEGKLGEHLDQSSRVQAVCDFFEKHLQSETSGPPDRPPEVADEQSRAEEAPDSKPPKRPKDEPIADISPELATHEEVEPLDVQFKRLTAFRLREDGCLVACDADAKEIRTVDPSGRQTGVIAVDFAPESIDLASDGTIYCGGQGRLAHLSANGEIICETKIPDDAVTKITTRRRGATRPIRVSGIAVSERDVFVAFGSGWSTGSKSKLFRFDRQLQNPVLLAEGLRGCCQRCDIIARDGVLYLAENSAHRVVLYNRDGEVLDKWGERSRTELAGFGACCNPMNVCFDAQGNLYTAESGLGRIKRYTTDGQYLDLVGYVDTTRFWGGSGLAASCSNMTIAITPDAERVLVMDYKNNQIRVLQQKEVVEEVSGE